MFKHIHIYIHIYNIKMCEKYLSLLTLLKDKLTCNKNFKFI